MSEKKDGGPAFPTAGYDGPDHTQAQTEGMTLRDWFAGQALNGLLSAESIQMIIRANRAKEMSLEDRYVQALNDTVKMSIELADAMLDHLEKSQ